MPCGGIDDMAVYAARMWQRWASWLDPSRGTPSFPPGGEYCPSPQTICDEQNNVSSIKPMHRREGQKLIKDLYRILAPAILDNDFIDVSITPESTTIRRAKSEQLSSRRTALLSYLRKLLNGEIKSKPKSARIHPALRASRLQQGWTAPQDTDTDPDVVAKLLLNVLRSSGAEHVLESLQGTTEVQLVQSLLNLAEKISLNGLSSTRSSSSISSISAVPVIEAESIYASALPLEYAGASLSGGDFDKDGYVDLVVTAPGHTSVGSFTSVDSAAGDEMKLPQSGAFYIRYGNVTMSSLSTSSAESGIPESLPQDFPYLVEGTKPFERLGVASCVLDANGDGVDDIAISAPSSGWNWQQDPWDLAPSFHYIGEIRLFFGKMGEGLPSSPSAVILGPSNNTHAGLSLVCADVNGDGFRDLLIGSHFAFTSTTQSGRADIFLSGASAPAFQPGAILTLDSSDYSWTGKSLGDWFGYSIAVSNSFTGTLDDETSLLIEKNVILDPESINALTICKNKVKEGESPSSLDTSAEGANANTLVIIGAPGYKTIINGGQAAVGRISGFLIPHSTSSTGKLAACLRNELDVPVSPAPLFTITADSFVLSGPTITSKLGHGVALGEPYGVGKGLVLAVGMTAVDFCNSTSLTSGNVFNSSAGSVTLFTLTPAIKGDYLWSDITTTLAPSLNTTVLASNLPDARFGWRLLFSDVNGDSLDDLIVGAPMKTPFFIGLGVPKNDTGHEAGSVYGYKGGSSFPFIGAPKGLPGAKTCSAPDNAWFLLEGQGEFGRFGEAMMVAEENNELKLFVSAPRVTEIIPPQGESASPDSATIEMPGAVYAFRITA